jgi:hypothetical protein
MNGLEIYQGKKLFELKATHGLPLDIALDHLFAAGVSIDWTGFIDCARSNGWYDFKIIALIETSLEDCLIDRDTKLAIVERSKAYIMDTLARAI